MISQLNPKFIDWIQKNNQIDSYILRALMDEYSYATSKFGKFLSPHEGISIIREEYKELENEVFNKNRNYPKMWREATHLATMAIRFMNDVEMERLKI